MGVALEYSAVDQTDTDSETCSGEKTTTGGSSQRNSDPTVSCASCNREWVLDFELDELRAGNRALEQFALDHYRHTGHYPDDVTPWVASCEQCPAEEQYLEKRPAKRFATTHARHTQHTVLLTLSDEDESRKIGPESRPSDDGSESHR